MERLNRVLASRIHKQAVTCIASCCCYVYCLPANTFHLQLMMSQEASQIDRHSPIRMQWLRCFDCRVAVAAATAVAVAAVLWRYNLFRILVIIEIVRLGFRMKLGQAIS